MKRILFVAEDLFPLGPSQSLIRRIHELAADGVEVHVGLLRPLAADFSLTIPASVHRLSDVTAPADAGDHGPDSRIFSLIFNRKNASAISKVRKLVWQLQPDLVHAWCTPTAMLTLAAVQGFSGAKIPELVCSELFHRQSPGERVGITSFWLRRKYSRALVPDERIGREIIGRGLAEGFEVIPNRFQCGTAMFPHLARTESAALLRNELGLPDDAKIAVAVAPLVARSRIKDLIWATDLLAVIRKDFHFVIFGCGEQYADLRRFSGQTEAEQHIHFLGRPPNAWALFQGGDVFWHSHLLEPLPVNMLNAMSLSIPVVSVFGDGTSAVVRHQSTGFATNFGARDEFARWTKYILEQPDHALQLGDQGRRFVESVFGI